MADPRPTRDGRSAPRAPEPPGPPAAPEPSGPAAAPTTVPGSPKLFAAAMAALSVVIAFAELVDRPDGVSLADHASRGLVPIAIAGLLAVIYPRLRPAGRGLVALSCGALAVTAGLALFADPAGPPATGIGAGLLLLGATTMWRGRRSDGSRARRYTRRALTLLGVLVVANLVVLPIGIAIVVTHRAHTEAVRPDLGRAAEAVTLRTSDGLDLAASYVPSRNRAAVIVFPGRRGVADHARMLVRHGYGVLVLDRRGEGASDGDFNARGWGGEPDLVAALDFLAARPEVDPDRIGGLGLSVGGELLLQTAASDGRLRAVVSDGAGIRSLAEQRRFPGIAAWRRPISPFAVETLAGVVLTGGGPPEDLATLVGRIAPRRVLLVRALKGHGGEELNRVYHAAAPATTELWEVQAGHTDALADLPEAYEQRVVGFLDRELSAG